MEKKRALKASADCLPLGVLSRYDVLSDYYISKDEEDSFIAKIDKSFLEMVVYQTRSDSMSFALELLSAAMYKISLLKLTFSASFALKSPIC